MWSRVRLGSAATLLMLIAGQAQATPEFDREIDAGLLKLQARLPVVSDEHLSLTSVQRQDSLIVYNYNYDMPGLNQNNFDSVAGKTSVLPMMCDDAQLEVYLQNDYAYVFNFHFSDGSISHVSIDKMDCLIR